MSDTARKLSTSRSENGMTVVEGPRSQTWSVLYIDGPLRFPISHKLRHTIRALLRRGTREIVLDLGRVSRIDAAGVGELVRAHNMAKAANRVLRIARPTPWVSWILDRLGLLDALSRGPRRRLMLLR